MSQDKTIKLLMERYDLDEEQAKQLKEIIDREGIKQAELAELIENL